MAAYDASAKSFKETLIELDEIVRLKTRNLERKTLIVSHPSWSYFADEYGFTQVSIEREGKEIQARSLVKLIKIAKINNKAMSTHMAAICVGHKDNLRGFQDVDWCA